MRWIEAARRLLELQIVLLASVMIGLAVMDVEAASYLKLYEILGALTASTITVFGLLNMKRLTEN